jgi:hypothetical protein
MLPEPTSGTAQTANLGFETPHSSRAPSPTWKLHKELHTHLLFDYLQVDLKEKP